VRHPPCHSREHLSHRLDLRGVQFLELFDVSQDGIELALESLHLGLRQLEVGQLGHPPETVMRG